MDIDTLLESMLREGPGAVALGRLSHASDVPRIVYANAAFERLFDRPCDSLLDATFDTVLAETYGDRFLSELAEHLEGNAHGFECDINCRRGADAEFWASVSCTIVADPGGTGHSLGLLFRDIGELKEREERAHRIVRDYERLVAEHERIHKDLAEAQTRLFSAMDAHPDPFVIYDKDLRLVTCNTAYRRSMADSECRIRPGMHVREVLNVAIECGLIIPGGVDRESYIDQILKRDSGGCQTEDLEFEGDIHQRVLRSFAENGDRLVLRMDTTELVRGRREVEDYARRLEEANDAILKKALQDDLTGLGNRRFLAEKMQDMIGRRRVFGSEIAALHIDLDRFKHINDTMGHAAGDHVIRDVAARIQDRLLDGEEVARIGGDEFVVLVPCDGTGARAEALALELVQELARPSRFQDRECRFGASVGVARTPLSDENDLLTNSDVALYKAKRRGRGQVGIFSREDIKEMRQAKRLADDILRAIECSEFVPYYQPQVDAATGRIVAIEALARWSHPERGLLEPNAFIPIASDVNALTEIDRAIFEKAVIECSTRFADHPDPPSLSFNISVNRITDESIAGIAAMVARYPGAIAFELLETIYLEEQNDAFMMNLDALRELGVSFEVDDFGSGRASVVALQRIAPDRLKIDRRLVQPVASQRGARRLVQSIVDIGLSLGIGVTAEGVECAEQAGILAELGCDRLQGFHFFSPSPLEAVLAAMSDPGKAGQDRAGRAIGPETRQSG